MKKILKILLELFLIYPFCGGIYLLIETIYRGYTFLGMYYLAGLIGVIAYFINNTIFSYNTDFVVQCSVMTFVATFLEGLYGNISNMDYNVWDYRNLPLSFWNDQCNLIFCLFWMIIMVIAIPLLDYIDYKFFDGEKPYYIIFGKRIF